MPVSSRIKNGINRILAPAGLELNTTRSKRVENRRLYELQQRRHWGTPRYAGGLDLNDYRYLRFLSEICGPFQSSLDSLPNRAGEAQNGFFLDNDYFGGIDAGVLYCLIRSRRPRQIIECGSGFSTRLMRRAIEDEELATHLTAIDPQPRVEVTDQIATYLQLPVERVEISTIVDQLDSDDILFVDSSHQVQTGGDVSYLCLEVLPKLRPGVLIHFHDIFLPFEYPEEWVVGAQWGWTEQYLVHAFLSFNHAFEIVWAARYMWEYHRREIEAVMPRATHERCPGSLWIQKTK